ncbi:hypothetical protein ES702_03192 [subsurface metagenome]
MPYITEYSVTALANMTSNIEQICVADGLKIVRRNKISGEMHHSMNYMDKILEMVYKSRFRELAEVLEKAPPEIQEAAYEEYGLRYFRQASHFIEYQFNGEIAARPYKEYEDITKRMFSVVTSLRLLKPGAVGSSYSHHMTKGAHIRPASADKSRKNWYDTVQLIYSLEPYKLLEEDVLKLKEMFNAVECAEGPVRVALDRFDSQYGNKTEIGKLIDIMVAFEALYLTGNQELSYKLALHGAKHLGDSDRERKKIYDWLRIAYTLRSNIIHGSINEVRKKDLKGKWESPTDMVEQLCLLLRKALNSILLSTQNFDKEDFVQRLDKAILMGTALH